MRPDGTFTIDHLAPGAYTLRLWSPDQAPMPATRGVRVPPGGEGDFDNMRGFLTGRGGVDEFVDQSALTGESFPSEKTAEVVKKAERDEASGWTNYLFMGTSVTNGTATAVIIKTGRSTQYGEIVGKIKGLIGSGGQRFNGWVIRYKNL